MYDRVERSWLAALAAIPPARLACCALLAAPAPEPPEASGANGRGGIQPSRTRQWASETAEHSGRARAVKSLEQGSLDAGSHSCLCSLQAHQLSSEALESSSSCGLFDWRSSVARHRAAAAAFQLCTKLTNDADSLHTLQLLANDHWQRANTIETTLDINKADKTTAAAATPAAGSAQRKASGHSLSSPPPSTALVQTTSRTAHISDARLVSLSLAPSLVAAPPSSLHLLQVVHVVQLVRVLLQSPSSLSLGGMSYAQLQTILQEIRQLAQQLSNQATNSFVSSSSQPPVSVSEAEEEAIGQQLRQKLQVAEGLHQYLAERESLGGGLSGPQLASFHAQFIRLQQAQFASARSELLLQAQLKRSNAALEHSGSILQRKLMQLESMLSEAAKVALANNGNNGSNNNPDQLALLPSLSSGVGGGGGGLLLSSAPAAPSSSSASMDAQLKQLLLEKAQLEKQLSQSQRQVALERSTRLKAEKTNEKHEQRWKALNDKVAAKKAQTAAAASPMAAAPGGGATTGSGVSTAAAASGAASGPASSTSDSSSASSSASGSLARPPSLAQSGRALSANSTPPPSLHVARPVQLR